MIGCVRWARERERQRKEERGERKIVVVATTRIKRERKNEGETWGALTILEREREI